MKKHASAKRVWRPRLLVRELRGQFLITDGAVSAAERLLPSFRGPEGDHEGIVFLLGRELGPVTLFTAALAPNADHGRGHVFCSEAAVAAAAATARRHGLALLGQVHTHGAGSTEHSPGDDKLIIMPFEGMLSAVAPWYGRVGLRPLDGLGVHQFQDGRWVLVERDSLRDGLRLVPDAFDLR